MKFTLALLGIAAVAGTASAQTTIFGVRNLSATSSQLVRFQSNDPANLAVIGPMTGIGGFVGGLEADRSGNLFAWNQVGGVTGLYRINQTTGAGTFIGSGVLEGGRAISDLSFNPVTNQMIGIAVTSTTVAPQLYSIDLNTGAPTLLGTIAGAGPSLDVGLAHDSAGNAYIQDINQDRMYRLNGFNAVPLGAGLGYAANFGQGMTINWRGNNEWYLAAFNTSPQRGEFRTVDINTGATTLVGAFGIPAGATSTQISDIAIIPAPSALALLGLGGLIAGRRRR